MSTGKDVIKIVETFADIPITALTEIVRKRNHKEPLDDLTDLISLQKLAKKMVLEREEMDPDYGEAIYNLAKEEYANEEDMQTNVDPLELPFDVSEADDGTWAAAWVWVPNDVIEEEMLRLKRARRDRDLAAE